jgi:hypothetical protein
MRPCKKDRNLITGSDKCKTCLRWYELNKERYDRITNPISSMEGVDQTTPVFTNRVARNRRATTRAPQSSELCPVCQETFGTEPEEQRCRWPQCMPGHHIHRNCADELLISIGPDVELQCPTCRRNISDSEILLTGM